MRIDAHQHYWHTARGDYDWMPKDVAILNRPYLPADLAPALAAEGIAGTVLVQAAATLAETEYMLGIADATPSVKGVVGWIDFENKDHAAELRRLAQHPKFLGVRPMIQDIADVDWMLRGDVQWAFEALIDLDLTFDALGLPQHIANFHKLFTRYPEMRAVIDHMMKPRIRDQMAGEDAISAWASGMSRLAAETTACVKLSGMMTEAAEGVREADLQPFAHHVLDAFGPGRVMWGSDWPVCRLRTEYGGWLGAAQRLCSHLGAIDQSEIFGGTALRFYRLA